MRDSLSLIEEERERELGAALDDAASRVLCH
jgi:hypothetical protein